MSHPTVWRRRRTDAAALAAAAVVVGLSTAVAAGGVTSLEADLFHLVNDAPDWLYRPAWLAQFLGLLLVPAVVAVVALVFRRWRLAVALLLLIPLKLFVEKVVVKELVYRPRPGSSVCDGDPTCLQARGDVPLVGPSFPSGHVIIAVGIAWLVAPYVSRPWRWVLAGACLVVALSRVYLGAHNPLDVLAGAACGVAVGAALNLLVGVPAKAPDPSQYR
jgi:membrane-associated phospholipid phosphatase